MGTGTKQFRVRGNARLAGKPWPRRLIFGKIGLNPAKSGRIRVKKLKKPRCRASRRQSSIFGSSAKRCSAFQPLRCLRSLRLKVLSSACIRVHLWLKSLKSVIATCSIATTQEGFRPIPTYSPGGKYHRLRGRTRLAGTPASPLRAGKRNSGNLRAGCRRLEQL